MAEAGQDDTFETLPIGERLKRARESRDMALEDVASRTRIPLRHLKAMEAGEWDSLPAITYSVGFARSYANAVGLDGEAIGRELRERLGEARPMITVPEYYEPADPARVPPRSLALIAALVGIALVAAYLVWRGSLSEPGSDVEVVENAAAPAATTEAEQPTAPPPLAPETAAGQPVALIATDEVWLRVGEAGGSAALFQGILRAGDRYDVPATATRPVIRTGRPQVLRVNVGGRDLGPLEPVERTVSDVSLRAEDLVARNAGAAGPSTP